MDEEGLREIAERDQLWASLRPLAPEIAELAKGGFDQSERQTQLVQVLARIVECELRFRAERSESE